jgi:hypothetical protein
LNIPETFFELDIIRSQSEWICDFSKTHSQGSVSDIPITGSEFALVLELRQGPTTLPHRLSTQFLGMLCILCKSSAIYGFPLFALKIGGMSPVEEKRGRWNILPI